MPVGRPYPVAVTVAGLVFLPNEDSEKSDCKLLSFSAFLSVAGYGFGSPGISTTDVVIGLFYICK